MELICCIPCLLRENLAAGSKKRLAVVFCNSWGWGEAERGELEDSRAPESQGTPEPRNLRRAHVEGGVCLHSPLQAPVGFGEAGPRDSTQHGPRGMCRSGNPGSCFFKLACKSPCNFQGLGILFYLD